MAHPSVSAAARPRRSRVMWVINSACPSRCVYCDIESQRAARELDAEQVRRAARDIVAAGFSEVTFAGGEPLLFRHLGVALEELRGRCQVALFTGGLPGDPAPWATLEKSPPGAQRPLLETQYRRALAGHSRALWILEDHL